MKNKIYAFPGRLSLRVHSHGAFVTLDGGGYKGLKITRDDAAAIARGLRASLALLYEARGAK